MSRKTVIWVVLLALITLSAFGFRQFSARETAGPTDLETAVVKRGTLVARVSASGRVEANQQVSLTFPLAGQVLRLLVKPGDQVAAGDPLVQLDPTELELQVAQARAGLTSAQARLAQLLAGASAEEIAAAEAALASAQSRLEALQAGPQSAEIQAARAAVVSAQENLNKVLAGPSQFERDSAKRNLDLAKNQLYVAQTQRDSVCGGALSRSLCKNAEAQVLVAQVNVDQAAAALEALNAPPDPAAVAAARAQLAQAQAQLQRLLDAAGGAEVAAAEAQMRQAEATLQRLRQGPSAEERAVAEAQVAQAQVALQQAELLLENATLKAPMAGTVAAVHVAVGEFVTAARPVVELIDTSSFKLVLAIDETDVGQISVGQPATITLDAFPAAEVLGEVTDISPVGVVQQGIVTYAVTVRPVATDLPLRVGMTAGVDVIVARKENVLLIPNRAIRSENGRRVVLVPQGEGTKVVEVEIGLRNDQDVEIVHGLSEGDRVITSVVPTNNPLEGGFFR